MLQRSCLLSVIMAAACTTAAAVRGEDEARPNEVPGWGRVLAVVLMLRHSHRIPPFSETPRFRYGEEKMVTALAATAFKQ